MALCDTNFLIDLMKSPRRKSAVSARAKLNELVRRRELLHIAVFTIGELHVGIAKGNQPNLELKKVESALASFKVLPFQETTACIFGGIVGELGKQGLPISDMDALIGSVAVEHRQLLVTRNVRHFQCIPGLIVEGY